MFQSLNLSTISSAINCQFAHH